MVRSALALLAWCAATPALADDHAEVRGMTISTPTWGWEWGTDAMAETLDELGADGVNWVAIHPYARVQRDGRLTWRNLDPDDPPEWLARPIREAHARGQKVMVKPHLAYWGSGFAWRGDITFSDARDKARFFEGYRRWIGEVAAASADADALAVGTELDRTLGAEAEWRHVIGDVRGVFDGLLTYAANWDRFEEVPFWDALDCVGIQGYFPLARRAGVPSDAELDRSWDAILERVRRVHARTGKPVVFTELGYDASATAALRPWETGGTPDGGEVQRAALRAAFRAIAREPALRGAFLWKWFPGELAHGDFRMVDAEVRAVIRAAWGRP